MTLEELKNQHASFNEAELLRQIDKYKYFIKRDTYYRILDLNKNMSDSNAILNEWSKIQKKESYLTNAQRKEIAALVGICILDVINKDNETV